MTVAKSRPVKSLSGLLALMWRYPFKLLGALSGVALSALLTLSVGAAASEVVDQMFQGESLLSATQLIFFIALFFFLLAIASGVRLYFIGWVGERVMADLRNRLHRHILRQPPAFFELRRTGDLIGRITTDSAIIQTLIVSTGSMALRNLLVVVFSIIAMFYQSLTLSLALFITMPPMMIAIIFCARRVRMLSKKSQETLASVGSHTEQSLSGLRIIQAFGNEERDVSQFASKVEESFDVARARLRMRALLTSLVLIGVIVGIGLMIHIGVDEVRSGAMSPGDFTGFIYYAILSCATAGVLSESLSDVMRAAGAADRLFDILAHDTPVRQQEPTVHIAKPQGSITIQSLSFTYPSGHKALALDDFTMSVGGGEHVALVGPSGAGKSTVMLLLLRFYDAQSGSITIDDANIRQVPLSELRSLFAFIPQETIIFAGTLRDNLTYANEFASDRDFHEALEKAALGELVRSLPDGLDTEVGERGLLLSGGERQRLSLARAFLRRPRILLLDEPTSALDSHHESEISASLQELMHGRTSITIAHRLATVHNADRIIVMDHGKAIGNGNDAFLMKNNDLYRHLKNLQFRTIPPKKN